MSFKISRSVYVLEFAEGTLLHGATVKCKGVPLGAYFDIERQQENGEVLFEMFAEKVLDSWDLEEEDGTPIQPTKEGLLSLEPNAALSIVQAWSETVSSVPLVKESSLNAGSTSEPETSQPS